MEILTVTEYGTIRGNFSFKEIKIANFLKKLEKEIANYQVYYNSNDTNYITYDTSVESKEENKYEITIDEAKYYLNIDPISSYYPILKKKLDMFSEISKKNQYKRKTINDIESNKQIDEHNNEKDLKIYFKHLLNLKKEYRIKEFLLALRGFYGPIGLLIAITMPNVLTIVLAILSGIVWVSDVIVQLINWHLWNEKTVFHKFKKIFRRAKLNNLKMNALTKKLNKIAGINSKIDAEIPVQEKETIPKRDAYKDAIIGYMNTIMVGCNKLNDATTRIKKLNELKIILDEYLTRMQEFNNKKEKGLTLENDEHVIVHEIIDKLTTLEMEIAELIKRDNENKKVTSEGDVLMNQIDEYLQVAKVEETKQSNDKKRTLSR